MTSQAWWGLRVLGIVICSGCAASPRAVAIEPADEAAQVRAVVDRFYAAALERDWDAVGALLADDFEIYTDAAASYRKAEYLALLKQDDLDTERMSLADVEVRVAADGSMAWSTFRGAFEMTSHGRRHDVRTVETLIFENARPGWKIARAHASVQERKD